MARSRALKVVATVLGALLVVVLAGVFYEAIAEARDARRFPPPGRLVDIGSRRLHLLCIGAGNPVVLFENGAFNNSVSLAAARTEIARRTQVCSYDRQGVGWSDPAPWSTTVGTLADELGVLQDRAGVPTPVVIVASSMGGIVTEMFARRYPERVAGLVFLDAATSDMLPILEDAFRGAPLGPACVAVGAAGPIGLARVFDPFALRADTSDEGVRTAALMYGSQPWSALCAIVRRMDATKREFAEAPPLRADVPIVVMSADSAAGLLPPGASMLLRPAAVAALVPRLRDAHKMLAKRSSAGSWKLVKDSPHSIAGSHPDVVVDAVQEILISLRRR